MLVSHVLLVIRLTSGSLQVAPFSVCSKKHSQTGTLLLYIDAMNQAHWAQQKK